MLGEFGKFDQRILPSSDTVRITPYAVNRAVKREEKQQFRNGDNRKKQPLSYEEKITLSSAGEDEDRFGVFDEYKDAEEWVSLSSLLANASMRLKLLTLKQSEPDIIPDTEEVSEPAPPPPSVAYIAYQNAVNRNSIENSLSFEEKVELSDIISHESDDERLTEIEHLNKLIPGLQALIDAGYTHMPVVEGAGLLDTAGKAAGKLNPG